MQTEKRPQTAAVFVESEAIELPTESEEVLFATATGNWNCCDVWIHATTSAWDSHVTIKLYGKLGRARALLATMSTADVDFTVAGAERSALALSMRGHPCSGFEVTCTADSAAPLEAGVLYLQCWNGDATASAQGDALVVAQGRGGSDAWKVDGSAVTQPVSVSNMIAAVETGLAKDATLTGGTLKAIARGAAKGGTAAADVTASSVDSDHTALDVVVKQAVSVSNMISAVETGLAKDATLTGGTVKAIARGAAKGSTAAADVTATSIDSNHTALDVSVVGSVTVTDVSRWLGSSAPSAGQKAMTSSLPVAIASDQSSVPVSLAAAVDVSDRAGRLAGVVYGSQAAQLKQTSTNNNLQAELAVGGTLIDPRAIRALTTTDAVAAAQGTAAASSGGWPVKITDGTDIAGITTLAGGTKVLKVDSTGWMGSTAPSVGQKAMASSVPVVIASDQTALAPPTLTKGTQGGTGYMTQNLKDSGRTLFVASVTGIAGVTTEATVSLTPNRAGTAGTAGTSLTVTSGKTLRLTGMVVTWRNPTAAAGGVTVRLRISASGAIGTSTQAFASLNATTSLATTGSGQSAAAAFPDGIGVTGSMQFGVTQVAVTTASGVDIDLIGFEY